VLFRQLPLGRAPRAHLRLDRAPRVADVPVGAPRALAKERLLHRVVDDPQVVREGVPVAAPLAVDGEVGSVLVGQPCPPPGRLEDGVQPALLRHRHLVVHRVRLEEAREPLELARVGPHEPDARIECLYVVAAPDVARRSHGLFRREVMPEKRREVADRERVRVQEQDLLEGRVVK